MNWLCTDMLLSMILYSFVLLLLSASIRYSTRVKLSHWVEESPSKYVVYPSLYLILLYESLCYCVFWSRLWIKAVFYTGDQHKWRPWFSEFSRCLQMAYHWPTSLLHKSPKRRLMKVQSGWKNEDLKANMSWNGWCSMVSWVLWWIDLKCILLLWNLRDHESFK